MWIALRRENCNCDGVLQDKWGSTETAMGIHDCGCRHTRGMGMGVRADVDVNFFMRCTVYTCIIIQISERMRTR